MASAGALIPANSSLVRPLARIDSLDAWFAALTQSSALTELASLVACVLLAWLVVTFSRHPFPRTSGPEPQAGNMVTGRVPAYTKGMEVREMIEAIWIPRLEDFKPEMIFISAGFDAHRDDELGQLGLVEQDYAWITQRIKDVAKRHAQGRIVSSLEGGYNLRALGRSVEAHVRGLADL